MTKFAARLLPEMEEILRNNGIDVTRVTDATIHHSPKGAITEITVTMLALKSKDETV